MYRNQGRLLLTCSLAAVLLSLLHFSVSFAALPQQNTPPMQADGQEYVVQAGDSLYAISREYLGSAADYPRIVDATNAKAETDPRFTPIANPSLIRVGQLLWIPSGIEDSPDPTATSSPCGQRPLCDAAGRCGRVTDVWGRDGRAGVDRGTGG